MNNLIGIDTAFRTVSGRNLMEYTFENGEVIGYQLEMIANNQILGLLKSEVVRVDGKVRLSYDITSLIPLQKLFERREIGRNDFLNILNQIVSATAVLDEYLLDSGGMVFDSRFIFVNPQDLNLEFAYLPKKDVSQNLEALKKMLLESIINDIRFKNEPSDNYVQKLIELLKTTELDIPVFKEYIKSMEGKSLAAPEKPAEHVVTEKAASSISEVNEKKMKINLPPQEAKPLPKNNPVKSSKLCYPAKSFIILGSVLGAFAIFGMVLSFTDTFSMDNPDFLLSLFGYLMIGGALTYLVYSKLFAPDKRIEKPMDVKSDSVQPPVRKMEYVNKAFAVPEVNKAKAEVSPVSEIQDRTVILDAGSLKQPSLKGIGENKSESILITRFPFMLGRLEGQVDYCLKNPAVGKMHAEITNTEEGYFITDMNSRNGTLLNGERLEPSREYKLENGAHIAFANDAFVFIDGHKNE